MTINEAIEIVENNNDCAKCGEQYDCGDCGNYSRCISDEELIEATDIILELVKKYLDK